MYYPYMYRADIMSHSIVELGLLTGENITKIERNIKTLKSKEEKVDNITEVKRKTLEFMERE